MLHGTIVKINITLFVRIVNFILIDGLYFNTIHYLMGDLKYFKV